MSNDGSEIEGNAGIDMVPVGEFFEWNPGPDDGDPTLRTDFSLNLKVSNPVAISSCATDLKRLS
jgi:hypothetical protein